MKEFLMRGIEEEIEIPSLCTIKTSRLKTNKGHESIKFEIIFIENDNKQYINFSSDNLGDDYQMCAEKFIKAARKIIENPCDLPE